MKKSKRILSLFLAVIMLILPISSCASNSAKTFTPSSDSAFAVVCDSMNKNNPTVASAIEYISGAVKALYSVDAELYSDSEYKHDGESYTFIIGNTTLTQSKELPSSMKINDYAYKILGDKTVVIDGGSSEALYDGVLAFCSDVLGYTDGKLSSDKPPTLIEGTYYAYTATYESTDVTVNGIPISEFKISVKSRNDLAYADALVAELGKHNGYSVPVVEYESLTENDRGVILLGMSSRDNTATLSTRYKGYRLVVSEKNGYTLGVIGSNDNHYKNAVDTLFGMIKTENASGTANITLPTETTQSYTYTFDYGENAKWQMNIDKTVSEEISDGILYKEYYYTDGDKDNYVANVLYVDTSKYSFYLGLPSEGEEYQTVTEQMKNVQASGKNVVAAVNGDRWDTWLGTERLHGLTVQDGKLIDRGLWDGGQHNGQTLADKPYLALTKTGEYVIGASVGTTDISRFSMAVGGDYVLVERAVPQTYSDFLKYQPSDENHLKLYHPRTLVGITDDGDLILVTIDGRQKPRATGASMETCAYLMASLGCYSAISLDGGGSTEMVVKYGSDYTTKNIPSDGKSRVVKNTIVIVEK